MAVPTITLNDGKDIPRIGLGLWKVTDKTQFNNMFDAAVNLGYRHFDDAQAYSNEQFLGSSWRRSGLKREDIFITTKSLLQHFSAKSTLESFDESLKKLQTDYVDLLLVHFPGPVWLRKSKWQAIEQIKQSGRARSIGVSNHSVKHLKQLETYANEKPIVNQIEMHVFLQQLETRQYCDQNNIQIEAYSPLAHGQIMNDPVIESIANKHNKTYSQIMLRWCVDQNVIPLPKSTKAERLKENIEVFDFQLDQDDLDKLKKLDKNLKTLRHSILFG
jgi:diketogulonate reductase-like aldo/keto reductase